MAPNKDELFSYLEIIEAYSKQIKDIQENEQLRNISIFFNHQQQYEEIISLVDTIKQDIQHKIEEYEILEKRNNESLQDKIIRVCKEFVDYAGDKIIQHERRVIRKDGDYENTLSILKEQKVHYNNILGYYTNNDMGHLSNQEHQQAIDILENRIRTFITKDTDWIEYEKIISKHKNYVQ